MDKKAIWGEMKYNIENMDLPKKTDILIIGAGMTGLNLGYQLQNSGYDITLIDKGKVGMGISSKSTAKISYLQGDKYQKLNQMFGEATAKRYYESQKEGIDNIVSVIKSNRIDCDLELQDAVLFAVDECNKDKVMKERALLESFGEKTIDVNDQRIVCGFKVNGNYVMNPVKYMMAIEKIIGNKINIFENVLANKITYKEDGYEVETSKGPIMASIVAVTCHYPFFLEGLIPLKTYIQREYVNVGKQHEKDKFMAINVDQSLHSIRYYRDYIIYGSNKHKLTDNINYKINYDKSRNDFQNLFKKTSEYTWMNQDIMSNDELPFIGKLKDNLYMATGYNAWGMTNSMVGAVTIKDLIINGHSKYQELFDPRRKSFSLIGHSIINSIGYIKGYVLGAIKKSNPHYIQIKGILYGVYEDDKGNTHKVRLICPHMKCPLVFNNEEKTWDCPCHGSRFDLDGNIIEGPTTKGIKVYDNN